MGHDLLFYNMITILSTRMKKVADFAVVMFHCLRLCSVDLWNANEPINALHQRWTRVC